MGSSSSAPVSNQRPGFFRLLWRAARQIFHETTGALFFLLALTWTGETVRIWRHGANLWILGACAAFVLLLVTFGLTSFKSARRVR